MNLPNRERRDWTLIIFILPIGIILILIVGQIAIRMVPHWSVDAGMESNLDPNSEYIKPISLLQPLLPQILTPFAWAENYLTPMGDVNFPQFFVIEPSYTPSPTEVEPSETQVLPPTETLVPTATTPPPPTATQPSSTPPVEESETPDPTEEPTEPPALCEDTAATNLAVHSLVLTRRQHVKTLLLTTLVDNSLVLTRRQHVKTLLLTILADRCLVPTHRQHVKTLLLPILVDYYLVPTRRQGLFQRFHQDMVKFPFRQRPGLYLIAQTHIMEVKSEISLTGRM